MRKTAQCKRGTTIDQVSSYSIVDATGTHAGVHARKAAKLDIHHALIFSASLKMQDREMEYQYAWLEEAGPM